MENEWNDKYLLNIEEIDDQHKMFFDLWDKGIKQANTNDHQQMTEVIAKLKDYVEIHFKYEEEMLRKVGYSHLDSHIAEHQFFIQKVNILQQELSYNNPLLFEKTAVFMKKWFLGHIIQSDRKYKDIVISDHD